VSWDQKTVIAKAVNTVCPSFSISLLWVVLLLLLMTMSKWCDTPSLASSRTRCNSSELVDEMGNQSEQVLVTKKEKGLFVRRDSKASPTF
jgi:hypothetical protein